MTISTSAPIRIRAEIGHNRSGAYYVKGLQDSIVLTTMLLALVPRVTGSLGSYASLRSFPHLRKAEAASPRLEGGREFGIGLGLTGYPPRLGLLRMPGAGLRGNWKTRRCRRAPTGVGCRRTAGRGWSTERVALLDGAHRLGSRDRMAGDLEGPRRGLRQPAPARPVLARTRWVVAASPGEHRWSVGQGVCRCREPARRRPLPIRPSGRGDPVDGQSLVHRVWSGLVGHLPDCGEGARGTGTGNPWGLRTVPRMGKAQKGLDILRGQRENNGG